MNTGTDSRYNFGGYAPFSLEAWIDPEDRSESYKAGIIGNFAMNQCGCWNIGYGMFLSYPERTVNFVRSTDISGSSIEVLASTPVAANEWTHVVATFDGTTMQIFLNGQLVASKLATKAVTLPDSIVRIGFFDFDYGATDYPGFFAGSIDDAAIYDHALSATRIAVHAGYVKPPPDEPDFENISDAIEDPDAAVLPPDPDPVSSSDPDSPNWDGSGAGLMGTRKSPTRRTQSATEAGTDGVTVSTNANAYIVRNADGEWTIYRKCFDSGSNSSPRYNVGPGYIARLVDSEGRVVVDDYVGRSPANTGYGNETAEPGYLNAVNGGLGAFGWHHARGTPGSTPAGDDPTTASVESVTGRDPKAIEGRMCSKNGSPGVYATWESPVKRGGPNERTLTFDVFIRDQYGSTGRGVNGNAITRVRYRYRFLKSSVAVFMAVTTYAKVNAGGTPFVKEPKFAVVVGARGVPHPTVADKPRIPGYRTMTVYHARGTASPKVIREGDDVGTMGLDTDHAADPTRSRVRFDYTNEQGDAPACADSHCFNVVMRALPVSGETVALTANPAAWEGSGIGLDRWSVTTSALSKSYPRDTNGDDVVTSCGVATSLAENDANNNGVLDPSEYSKASESANTNMDEHRRWEMSGFFVPNSDRYAQAFAFFHGWENQAGPTDCEPLQRAFGPQGQTWGAYASYSVGEQWQFRP